MGSGRNQGWAWKHFYTDRTNYKGNKTHLNFWCLTELKFQVEILCQSDNEALCNEFIMQKQMDLARKHKSESKV